MFIKPTESNVKSIWDISDEIMIYSANEDVPCPWDADIKVSNGIVIIVGNLGPSGPANARCTCECSVKDFDKYYKVEVPEDTDLEGTGWIRA